MPLREDRRFNRAAARAGLVDRAVLMERLDALAVEPLLRDRMAADIAADFAHAD